MSGNPIRDLVGTFINPIAGVFGGSEIGKKFEQMMGAPAEAPSMEAQPTPPTMEEASAAARKSNMMKKATYGLTGTIRNTGGAKGVASSLLNLSSRSLVGK
jgi:hypothetical protein